MEQGMNNQEPRPRLVDDTSGPIVDGLFFELHASNVSSWSEYRNVMSVNNYDDDYTHTEVWQSSWEEFSSGRCPVHPDRKDIFKWNSMHCGLYGSESIVRDVIGGMSGDLCVSPRIVDVFHDQGFRGLRFAPVEVEYLGAAPIIGPYSGLCFDGREIDRPFRIEPSNAPDYCPSCRYAPIVCTGCSHWECRCPICSKVLFENKSPVPPAAYSVDLDWENGCVLNLNYWDGSDFVGGRAKIVTGAVVDVLWKLDVDHLCARPLRCYIGDFKPSEFKHLRSQEFFARYGFGRGTV